MIVLSDVHMPTEGVRLSQQQVEAYFDAQSAGDGTLCVSEGSVTWISRQTQKGISLTYPSIILHAVSTDLSSFPREHIYVLVDCSKAERRRRPVHLYTAEEAQQAQNLNMQDEQMDGEEEDDAESEGSPSVQIRFIPTDTSCLQTIYEQMIECQELNPDEDDIQSDDEGEENDEEIAGGGDIPQGGQWYTAENAGQDFQLSGEGLANLQRMMGGGDHRNNGHHHDEADDEQMDDS